MSFYTSDSSITTVTAEGSISAITGAIDGDSSSVAYIYTFTTIDDSWHRTKVIVN